MIYKTYLISGVNIMLHLAAIKCALLFLCCRLPELRYTRSAGLDHSCVNSGRYSSVGSSAAHCGQVHSCACKNLTHFENMHEKRKKCIMSYRKI